MIVRPTTSHLQTQRTRSQSNPPRRRANSTSTTLPPSQREAQPARPPCPPNPPPQQRVVGPQPSPTTPLPALPKFLGGDNLNRSSSGRRKLFRIKRPATSNGDTRAARERELQMLGPHAPARIHGAVGMSAFLVSPLSPSAPPRPPRNPARINLSPRPSSAGGPAFRSSRLRTVADEGELRLSRDRPAEWEFPLPRGSEFPLQRKKSKCRKFNSSQIAQDESAKSNVQFSTVDRTILQELRQKIRAREEQFITRGGRKYHAFSSSDVPYPRCYDRQMVDLDVWDDLWQIQLGASITMHVFGMPPARVLDLGCGTGTWILNAAREWKDCYFVGLDAVPLHPDLLQVGCFDLASRITWVQANFLESLPFPNEEFDYVRVTRVGRGVPEDRWDALFEEITRVMKPGGAFEMWEEDLHFPGHREESVNIIDSPDPMHPPTPPHTDSSHSSEDKVLPSAYALQAQRSLSFTYSFDDVSGVGRNILEDNRRPLHAIQSSANLAHTPILLRRIDRPPMNPHDHSLLQAIYNDMHASRFINLEPVSVIANLLPLHFRDVRAPPPIVITYPPRPPAHERPDASSVSSERTMVEDPCYSDSPTEFGTFTFMADGSPHVGLDAARYGGLPPSITRRTTLPLASDDKATHGQHAPSRPPPSMTPNCPSTALASRMSVGRNPLPNKTVNLDPRSLNLLLALRVNEVLGCAEPMWDWVVDFQESVARAKEFERGLASASMSEHITLRPHRRRRHPKQDAIMNLTRFDFDALMRRFELDMKARMYLGPAVEERLGWPSYPVTSTEERENFEAMCTAWADYEHRQAHGATGRERAASASKRSSSPHPPLPTPRHSKVYDEAEATIRGRAAPNGAQHVSHAHNQTHIPTFPIRPGPDGLSRRKSEPEKPVRPLSRPSTAASTTSSRLSEPEQEGPLTSRTGRIFVAWKAWQ